MSSAVNVSKGSKPVAAPKAVDTKAVDTAKPIKNAETKGTAPVSESKASTAPAPSQQDDTTTVGEAAVSTGQTRNPFSELIKNKESDIKRIREELNSLKDMEKWFKKEFTELAKIRKKKEAKALANADKPTKKPSGFAMECELSDELSTFLGLPKKSSLTRPAVHKLVTNYIKEKNLEDDKSRKIIHPDPALAKVLGVADKPNEVVTYLNLQHYLKHHFVKHSDAAQPQVQTKA